MAKSRHTVVTLDTANYGRRQELDCFIAGGVKPR